MKSYFLISLLILSNCADGKEKERKRKKNKEENAKKVTRGAWKKCKNLLANGIVSKIPDNNGALVEVECNAGYDLFVDGVRIEAGRSEIGCSNEGFSENVVCLKNNDPAPTTTTTTTAASRTTRTPWNGVFPARCAQPEDGAVQVSVIDRFKRNGKFGFVMNIFTTWTSEYSILLRFSNSPGGANFQTWNLAYWGFYLPDFILFHSKANYADNDFDDPKQFVLVAENMNTSEIPEVMLLNGHNHAHTCFRQGFERTSSEQQHLSETINELTTSVKLRSNGKSVKKAKGWKSP